MSLEIIIFFARFGQFIFSLGFGLLMVRIFVLERNLSKRVFVAMTIIGCLSYALYFANQLFLQNNDINLNSIELLFINLSGLIVFAGLFFNLLSRFIQIKLNEREFNQVVKHV